MTFYGQTSEDGKVIEALPDGTYIVKIGSEMYRALPPTKVREIMLMQANYDALEKSNTSLRAQFDTFRAVSEERFQKQNELLNTTTVKLNNEAAFWKAETESEKKLRLKFQTIVESCTGKIIFFRICTK